MYHYNPATALEELEEEGILPNPVHVRDMIIGAHLAPGNAGTQARRKAAKVDVAWSGNRMRVTPSVYKDQSDIDALLGSGFLTNRTAAQYAGGRPIFLMMER